ncbi:MAG: cysteine synthase A [bacterium]|nr:cysteine synthase A [bacterium]
MYTSLIDTIGRTPTVNLARYAPDFNISGKLESFNPLSCVKCRTAWGMIRLAEREGMIKPGDLIVEPTSGNTGIGLAWISRIRGYRLILTMPETMSIERRRMMEFLGAEIILTEGSKGMKGALARAEELCADEGAFMPDQFSNPGNVEIHYQTTGPEIWEQMDGKIDYAVFGVGTGGTLTGAGRYLKEKNPKIKIVAVEPTHSPVLSGGQPGPHKIQGIGAGFIPTILDQSLIDQVVTVSNDDAISQAKKLALTEGIVCGISCGAALAGCWQVAAEDPEARIITVLPDTGERYLSTVLFEPAPAATNPGL